MSTVLPPPAAAGLLLELPLLLPLLLQPTAASAIAAKAAIVVVRLMIFLSLLRLSGCRQANDRPALGSRPAAAGRWPVCRSPTAARPAQGVDSGQDPGPGECRRRRLGRRVPHWRRAE